MQTKANNKPSHLLSVLLWWKSTPWWKWECHTGENSHQQSHSRLGQLAEPHHKIPRQWHQVFGQMFKCTMQSKWNFHWPQACVLGGPEKRKCFNACPGFDCTRKCLLLLLFYCHTESQWMLEPLFFFQNFVNHEILFFVSRLDPIITQALFVTQFHVPQKRRHGPDAHKRAQDRW